MSCSGVLPYLPDIADDTATIYNMFGINLAAAPPALRPRDWILGPPDPAPIMVFNVMPSIEEPLLPQVERTSAPLVNQQQQQQPTDAPLVVVATAASSSDCAPLFSCPPRTPLLTPIATPLPVHADSETEAPCEPAPAAAAAPAKPISGSNSNNSHGDDDDDDMRVIPPSPEPEQIVARLRLTGSVRLVVDLFASPFRVRVDDGAPPCSSRTTFDGIRTTVNIVPTEGGEPLQLSEAFKYDSIEATDTSQLRFVYEHEEATDDLVLLERMRDAMGELTANSSRFTLRLLDSALIRQFPALPETTALHVEGQNQAQLRGHRLCFVSELRAVVSDSVHVEGLHITHALGVTSHAATAHMSVSLEQTATCSRKGARRRGDCAGIETRKRDLLASLLRGPRARTSAAAAIVETPDQIQDREAYKRYAEVLTRGIKRVKQIMERSDCFVIPQGIRDLPLAEVDPPLCEPYNTRLLKLRARYQDVLGAYDEWMDEHHAREQAAEAARELSQGGGTDEQDDVDFDDGASDDLPRNRRGQRKRRAVVRAERAKRAALERRASSSSSLLHLEDGTAQAEQQQQPPAGTEPTCRICLTNNATTVLIPCLHMPYCDECCESAQAQAAAEERPDKCPLCRRDVEGPLRVKIHW